MKIKTPNSYCIVLAVGFCIPLIFAAMADYNLTRFIKPNSSFEGIFSLIYFGLWPAVIMFQNSVTFFSKHGLPLLLMSDFINMTLYLCMCGGIYLSKKIETSEIKPLVILASFGIGVLASGGLALVLLLNGI
jgi:hypothetical protein